MVFHLGNIYISIDTLTFIMEQKSIFKSSVWKVFEIFIDEPRKVHYIKEISKKINLAPTSVKKYIENLQKNDMIIKTKGNIFNGYIANRDYNEFLFYKRIFNLIKIKESKLVDYLITLLYPTAIILYGSYVRGEDIEESDIDLLIISKVKKRFEIESFEKILHRKIHIIIDENLKNLNKNLRQEIINGYVLYGYLKDG